MADITLRTLSDADLGKLQKLSERSSDFYEQAYGHPPGPAEAQSVYMVLPQGTESYDDKLLFGVSEGDELVGFVDMIRNWPSVGTWVVGQVLLLPEARDQGRGKAIVGELERRAREEQASTMRLGVQRSNERARRFWERLGYRPLEPDARDEDPIRLVKELGS